MEPAMVAEKMQVLMKPCACGSGKMAGMCCSAAATKEIENEMCSCGSGKMVKDCCLKSPETHV